MSIEAKQYINGEWTGNGSGQRTTRENPANTSEIIGSYPLSGASDTAAAIEAAHRAFPAWKAMAWPARSEILHRAANILDEQKEELARTMTREMGKPISEARGEVKRGVVLLRYYAGEGMRSTGEVFPASDGKSLLYSNRVPLGVVGIITPWNFPVAIPLWKMAPALIYGNTVVWKPAEPASITAFALMQLLEKAGFPKGVINMVTGKGTEVGQTITSHRLVHGISFTGSNEVGHKVAMASAERGVKFQLEMGGKNPTIVAADADLRKAVDLTLSAAMRFCGQKCTATSRVIVEESVLPAFTEMLLEKAKTIKLSDPLEDDCYLGPVVNQSQHTNILASIDRCAKGGPTLLAGGKKPNGKPGYFIEPTIFGKVEPGSELGQKEIFGPVLGIISARNLEQAIEIANDVPFGLSAAIFTKDISRILKFIKSADAGMIKINGETAGVEPHAPFGGMKQSSSHSREQGRAAIEFFTSIQTIAISPSDDL
ncbi:MAG TPA: aldehyde dehydrogenase family protein [Verrucomicrobiae bacterium]|jgi:aldehyde dehydrogenase (NAD+)|nr:aldehyde dehydrogenase family protein [Verrucomicrobiae bacterium]